MTAKLHELLAVGPNLRKQAEATTNELKNTFQKKTLHFTKKIVTFKSQQEGVPDKVEEQHTLQTTVAKELVWIGEKIAKALDCAHRIDVANTTAKADVTLDDGTTILTGVPSTSLLQLEHRLEELIDFVKTIPTLDPSKGFTEDSEQGAGIFQAAVVEKPRTEKKFDFVVMVPATDKHPAQVKELMVDRQIGQIVQQEWSALITTAQKGDMLDRVENLARAVKSARSRANDAEVDTAANAIGDKLLNYVFNGKK